MPIYGPPPLTTNAYEQFKCWLKFTCIDRVSHIFTTFSPFHGWNMWCLLKGSGGRLYLVLIKHWAHMNILYFCYAKTPVPLHTLFVGLFILDCNGLPTIHNGTAELATNLTTYGAQANVTCNSGFYTDTPQINCTQVKDKVSWSNSTCEQGKQSSYHKHSLGQSVKYCLFFVKVARS